MENNEMACIVDRKSAVSLSTNYIYFFSFSHIGSSSSQNYTNYGSQSQYNARSQSCSSPGSSVSSMGNMSIGSSSEAFSNATEGDHVPHHGHRGHRNSHPSNNMSPGNNVSNFSTPSSLLGEFPMLNDPVYRGVLEFVDRRWKEVQAKSEKFSLKSSDDSNSRPTPTETVVVP